MNCQSSFLARTGMMIGNIFLYSLIIKGGYYEKQESKNKHRDI